MVNVDRFLADTDNKDFPKDYLPKQVFKSMQAGETIKDMGDEFYKNGQDELVYIYNPNKSIAEITEMFMEHPERIPESKNREFYKDDTRKYIYVREPAKSTTQLVAVDISRPWTIEEYDGAEYIEYLDYDVVDKDYNYCKKKGE